MNYSKAHLHFAEILNNSETLTDPEKFLGPNYETVLNFWKYLSGFNSEQWLTVKERYYSYHASLWSSHYDSALRMARKVVGKYGDNSWNATEKLACTQGIIDAPGSATRELIGMHLLLDSGKKLFFVPLFDNL